MSSSKTPEDLMFVTVKCAQWCKIQDLINQEIIVHNFVLIKDAESPYNVLIFKKEAESGLFAVAICSRILTNWLQYAKIENMLPMSVKIIKQGKTYGIALQNLNLKEGVK